MTLDELTSALQAADPAAVLVPGHLLARVIRQAHDLRGQGMTVPHRKSLIIDRAELFRHVEPDDLDLRPGRILPTPVILLARPALDRRSAPDADGTLLRYWRRLFHANVHLALTRLINDGRLTDADIDQRILALGTAEFDEARAVLEEENYLFPDANRRDVYIEFAAVFLELRFFVPDLLPVFFPAIREPGRVQEIIGRDIDAPAIFSRTRLGDVAEPRSLDDNGDDEPSDACWKLVREARAAARADNHVRAAILRTRAARIAPAALTQKLRADVEKDLAILTERLKKALKLTDEEAREWQKDLPPLVDKSGEEQWSVEAKLLYDLQKVCVEDEHEVYTIDIADWLQSAGGRPLRKPQTNQRLVRITRHLRTALSRLNQTRLSEGDRSHLGNLLTEATEVSEERMRARFRPVLANALQDVGLRPANPPERAALQKMIEELLDRIVNLGFFTFSDLRDAISRNNLKLNDLHDPYEWARGDPLLRLDRRLSVELDGVYRASEVYLRGLQRLTAPNFGTHAGRALTRYITLPILIALLLLQGVDVVAHYWIRFVQGLPDDPPTPHVGPASILAQRALPSLPAPSLPSWVGLGSWVLIALFIFGLMHVPAVREGLLRALHTVGDALRLVFIEWPSRILPLPLLRRLLRSWPVQLFSSYLLRPAFVCVLLLWFKAELIVTEEGRISWLRLGVIYLAAAILFNARPVRAAEEVGTRGAYRFIDWLRSGFFVGLYQLIMRAFKRMLDAVEYVLYTVDELLRFRSGDSRLSLVARAVLTVLWSPISYLIRLYVVVFLEPFFNPIKTPLSILAAKFVYPIILGVGLGEHMTTLIQPYVGGSSWLAWFLVWGVVLYWLPDAFAFLIWEMKENWKLYRANRPATLEAIGVGPHGETLLQLLRPGFHSGKVPKLFAQWRQAEREAHEGGSRRSARACREKMHEIEVALRRFVERDVVGLLHQAPGWQKGPLRVERVALASNLVRFEVGNIEYPGSVVRVAIAEQGGCLVARLEHSGWPQRLPEADQHAWNRALTGMYKLAGVDLVAHAVERALPEGVLWDVEPRGLVVRFGPFDERIYDLDAPDRLVPQPDGPPAPTLIADEVVFRRLSIDWAGWVEDWQEPAELPPEPLPPSSTATGPAPAKEASVPAQGTA